MKRFRDIENGFEYTIEELEKEYNELYIAGETETDTFIGYLRNCISKNGFLEVIA